MKSDGCTTDFLRKTLRKSNVIEVEKFLPGFQRREKVAL